MFAYTYDQLSKIVSIPIITLLLLWTLAIFHRNRKRWAPYDIPIVAILVQSVLRNTAVLTFTALQAANEPISFDYCSVAVWLFNSLHTFQATSLTTLALVGVFSAKLRRRQQSLRQHLTSTHLVYHLFCLTTLCACVGVAAILAQEQEQQQVLHQEEQDNETSCLFLPFELDVKFYVFVLALHVFLAATSFVAFLVICYHHCKMRAGGSGFEYMKKSTSDLSELSLGLSTIANPHENVAKSYYDTYTIPRHNHAHFGAAGGGFEGANGWNSDVSNISTTVSSTNSRKPCLGKRTPDEELESSGLETIHPVLIVSYLFHHVPLMILCAFPHLISPWSVSSVGLWLGLLQDLLIPISLGIVDSRFGKWISKVYRCSDRRRIDDKLPQVGLDGKFRPFGSQPQSLEVTQIPQEQRRMFQNTDHKFPITNGSLYTSIDGRLPIIHNYRRHKDSRVPGQRQDGNLLNLGLHSSHLKRVDYIQQEYPKQSNSYVCMNCTSATSAPPAKKFNLNSLDQSIRTRVEQTQPNPLQSYLRQSEQNVTNIEVREEPVQPVLTNDASSSDDDYYPDSMNVNDANNNFDTLSSKSSYSITTEANCDFDFYQSNLKIDVCANGAAKNYATPDGNVIFIANKPPPKPYRATPKPAKKLVKSSSKNSSMNDLSEIGLNFRITRSNSKRSLENLQAYLDLESQLSAGSSMFKSNSFVTLNDSNYNYVKGSNKLRDYDVFHKKIVESLQDFRKDADHHQQQLKLNSHSYFSGSVPDFKKVFISDYL